MNPLQLTAPAGRPLSVLAIGAHPDDIEIGSGGTLLSLAGRPGGLRARYVVLTGTADRQLEARAAAQAFLPGAELAVDLLDLPEGRLPAAWGAAKEALERVAGSWTPDLILAPSRDDAHQDHRVIGEIVPTVFRDHLSLSYEIPKWDGDLGRPSMYVPLSAGRRTAQGGAAAQVLPLAARPGLVGRRGLPRPGPAARHGVPRAVRRGLYLQQIRFVPA